MRGRGTGLRGRAAPGTLYGAGGVRRVGQLQRAQAPSGTAGDAAPIVYVVDDDDAAREYVSWLIESAGWSVKAFNCAEDFLDAYEATRPGCLVTDVRMPGLSGLDLQRELA